MKFKKKYKLIAILEGFIVCFANVLVLTLLKIFPTPVDFNENVQRYYEFVSVNYHLQNWGVVLGNIIPAILCFFYAFFGEEIIRFRKS